MNVVFDTIGESRVHLTEAYNTGSFATRQCPLTNALEAKSERRTAYGSLAGLSSTGTLLTAYRIEGEVNR